MYHIIFSWPKSFAKLGLISTKSCIILSFLRFFHLVVNYVLNVGLSLPYKYTK